MTPWTVAHQAPLSMGFSRQYWSGLPFPSPGDLDPGIEPGSPAPQAGSSPTEWPGKLHTVTLHIKFRFQNSGFSYRHTTRLWLQGEMTQSSEAEDIIFLTLSWRARKNGWWEWILSFSVSASSSHLKNISIGSWEIRWSTVGLMRSPAFPHWR